jgi:hypothetical protein
MDFYASLEYFPKRSRYSVGIYTPKGVGEGERPGLTVGTAGGIGDGCGCREIFTLTSIRTALCMKYLEGVGVKHRDSIILWVYFSLVDMNPSISLLFPSKNGYVFEIFLLLYTWNQPHSSSVSTCVSIKIIDFSSKLTEYIS